MPDNQPLLDFIDAAKSQGASDHFVVALLRQNGWSERRIYQAFGAWYESRTGKPVPSGGGRIEAAKDAFLYLLSFITLGIWAIQLGALLFSAIDRTFPNPVMANVNTQFSSIEMATELAGIIVGFPVFLLVTWWIVRGVQRQPERLESPVRKWLTYIALVAAASTMIADIVTFLAYLLRGDLDTRFCLKVLAVIVISGGVFAYYLDSLHAERASGSRNRLFALLALGAVAFGVIVGFANLGAPASQRLAAQDRKRLSDLHSLAQAVRLKAATRGQTEFILPKTIQDLEALNPNANAGITDPVSGQLYQYTPLSGSSYRLCATFSMPSPSDVPAQWRHAAGTACFTLDANENVAFVPSVVF